MESLALSIALGARPRPAPRLRLRPVCGHTVGVVAAPTQEATSRGAQKKVIVGDALPPPAPSPAAAAAKARRATAKSAASPAPSRLVVPLGGPGGGVGPPPGEPSPPGQQLISPASDRGADRSPSATTRSRVRRATTTARPKASVASGLLLPPAPSLLRLGPLLALDPPLPPDVDAVEEEEQDEAHEEADVDEEFFSPAASAALPGIPPSMLPIPEGSRGWAAIKDTLLMGLGEHEAIPNADWTALRARLPALQEHWRPMASYLYSLGLRDAEMSRLASKEPQIFTGNVGRARSRISFLRDSFSLTPADLVRVLATAPRVMFLRIERTLAKRLDFLRSLDVPTDKLGHVLTRSPNLLYTQVETMEPRVAYLCYVLRLERSDVGRMVVRHPKLLTNNESMVEGRLMFLFQLGLDDDNVRKMVMAHPQLLNYTPDSMATRFDWLTHEVGMTPEEVARTVSRLSQLFSLSVTNSLRPKFEYLTQELGGGKHTLLDCPTYLSLSLAARIVPRHRFLVARGRAESPFNVHHFIHADTRFVKEARSTLPEYEQFRARLIESNASLRLHEGGLGVELGR